MIFKNNITKNISNRRIRTPGYKHSFNTVSLVCKKTQMEF